MSESKTPQELRLNAEKLKHECSFVDWEEFAIFLVQVNENVRSQLTTAQQDLAKIAKALRIQQQRYHDLSEEVEGLKRERDDAVESTVRKCAEIAKQKADSITGNMSEAMCVERGALICLEREILSTIPQKEKKV